jgi:DNA end-binding protein Ku
VRRTSSRCTPTALFGANQTLDRRVAGNPAELATAALMTDNGNMARPTWKGFLRISLVNIPIKVFPATESAGGLSFNQLHAECQTRIQQRKWCPKCDRQVPSAEIVKGYEFEAGRYVILSDEDFDSVRPESTRVIDMVQFALDDAIDPMYVDRTYYLAPDGAAAGNAFAVMRDAMKGRAGVGKLAIYGREYLVAIRPYRRGLVMHTLHHDAEIRSIDGVEDLNSVPTIVPAADLKLARKVIDTFAAPLDLTTFTDAYHSGLKQIIDAKIAGKEIVGGEVVTPAAVVDLQAALKQSLAAISATRKKVAKATTARRKKAVA